MPVIVAINPSNIGKMVTTGGCPYAPTIARD
jgi:hypothetical protein